MSEELTQFLFNITHSQKASLGDWGKKAENLRKMIDEYPELKAEIFRADECIENLQYENECLEKELKKIKAENERLKENLNALEDEMKQIQHEG